MRDEADLIRLATSGVIAADETGHIVYANAAAEETMGRPLPQGAPLSELMPQRLRAPHRSGFYRYVHTSESHLEGKTVRVPALAADGSEHEVDLTIRIFERPDGSRLAVAGVERAATGKAPEDLRRIETELSNRLYTLI